ncbi:MAG TPA: hypothetical protein VFK58_07005 [Sphingomicrobium sp.]|nr:hypothetical protein [Sphingomicrobium sp.]
MRVGTLDDASGVEPDIHIYTRLKLPWVRLSEDCLAVEAFYDRNECWSEASLRRLDALFGQA